MSARTTDVDEKEGPALATPKEDSEADVRPSDDALLVSGNAGKDEIPDGGREAWMVVLGSTLALFATFGVVNAYGTFQDYYTTHLLTDSSASTISFIGSLQLFLLYGLGPLVGRVFDAYGARILMPLGSALVVVSMVLVSICQTNQPYQLFLSQGLLFGFGNAMIFTPALAVMGQWFRRRRAYVLGVVGAGSSLGGVVYPIMLQRLIPAVGFAWAVRAAALVSLACLAPACALLRTRAPLTGRVRLASAVDVRGFRDARYALAALGAFLTFYALFVPYFYIELFAEARGVAPRQAQYLLAILNACGIPARIVPGLLADWLGILPVLIPAAATAGILVLALWFPAHGAPPVHAFAALYGLTSGAFVTLLPAYVAHVVPPAVYGAQLGTLYFVVAVAVLAGSPTAGALLPPGGTAFGALVVFTGVLLLAGAGVFVLAHGAERVRRRRAAGAAAA